MPPYFTTYHLQQLTKKFNSDEDPSQPTEPKKDDHHQHNFELLAYTRFLPRILATTRPLAYSNEVAESFRHSYPGLIKPLYGLAFGYIGFDILHTQYLHRDKSKQFQQYLFGDSLLWHSSASVVLPGVIIHQSVSIAKKVFSNPQYNFSPKTIARVPIGVGLLMIPVIVKPIDHLVDYLMDTYLRPFYPKHISDHFIDKEKSD